MPTAHPARIGLTTNITEMLCKAAVSILLPVSPMISNLDKQKNALRYHFMCEKKSC